MPERASERVLWVTEEPPDRSMSGGTIRQAYLFEALARAYPVDLLLAGPLNDDGVRAAAANVVEIPKRTALMTDDAILRRLLELVVTLSSPYPLTAYMAGPARRRLTRAVRECHERYGLICVEHEALAPVIPARRSGPSLLTFHHLLSGMIQSEVELAPGWRQRWFRERDVRKARRLEERALRSYDRCVVCSEDDAAALSAIGGQAARERLTIIPNGVDLTQWRSVSVPPEPRVLFPGTLHYSPNVDGALWFCSEVWPRVRAAIPGATLTLAGRDPAPDVLRLSELPGVEVHADVPSMRMYFESTRVVVVPLRVGTGTRIKALEAMAAGRPVVGTAVGLGGIGVSDGVHALVADEPDKFAADVIETLGRDDLAAALGRAARRHVEDRFGWEQIGQRFVECVGELLARRDATPPVAAGAR